MSKPPPSASEALQAVAEARKRAEARIAESMVPACLAAMRARASLDGFETIATEKIGGVTLRWDNDGRPIVTTFKDVTPGDLAAAAELAKQVSARLERDAEERRAALVAGFNAVAAAYDAIAIK